MEKVYARIWAADENWSCVVTSLEKTTRAARQRAERMRQSSSAPCARGVDAVGNANKDGSTLPDGGDAKDGSSTLPDGEDGSAEDGSSFRTAVDRFLSTTSSAQQLQKEETDAMQTLRSTKSALTLRTPINLTPKGTILLDVMLCFKISF